MEELLDRPELAPVVLVGHVIGRGVCELIAAGLRNARLVTFQNTSQ